MIKLIPYIIYLLLIAFFEVMFRDLTRVFDVSINVTTLIVLLVALYKPERSALWFAFAAGVVSAAGIPHQMGWYCLCLTAVSMTTSQVKEHLDIATLIAKLVVIFCGTLLFNIMLVIFEGWGTFFRFLLLYAIPGAAYTTIVGWVFLLFKDHYITRQTIEEAI